MEKIIERVDRKLILKELSEDRFTRKTNNGSNHLYIITAHNAPHVMQEIGRLREITFRKAGGGTGKGIDIDAYDIAEDPYKQLIVWDPEAEEIIGGYRFFQCKGICDPNIMLATSRLFEFSQKFIDEYLPYTIELGRSFVQPDYQSSGKGRKSLYALDNLWDGLGALVVDYPEVKYFFGKVTMYRHYNSIARNSILYFMNKYFADTEGLLRPFHPLNLEIEKKEMKDIFDGESFQEDYKKLSQVVRNLGETIPPLINAYMNLSPSMRTFGTVLNPHFGNVEETAIMITINDLYKAKVDRHVNTYTPGNGNDD